MFLEKDEFFDSCVEMKIFSKKTKQRIRVDDIRNSETENKVDWKSGG